MSQSWHDFFFGAFDPWGTVSVDKLPGAFWLQALSLRVFGFHIWAYRPAPGGRGHADRARPLPRRAPGGRGRRRPDRRRRAGRHAGHHPAQPGQHLGLAARPAARPGGRRHHQRLPLGPAAAPSSSPASGSAWPSRPRCSRPGSSCPPSTWPTCWRRPAAGLVRRFGHVALSLLVAVVVSLSWMCVVTLVPAHDRPYVDGSCDNSVFSQVFLYNGADRLTGNMLDQPGCTQPPRLRDRPPRPAVPRRSPSARGPGRFLNGLLGRDAAWLFVPALVALVGILVLARRNEPRTDPWRAAALLWGVWLFLTWCFFAVLAIPQRVLPGRAGARRWPRCAASASRWPGAGASESAVVPVVVMATVVGRRGLRGLPRPGRRRGQAVDHRHQRAGRRRPPSSCLARSLRHGRRAWERRSGLALGAGALLLGAAWASATVGGGRAGPVRLALPAGGADGRGADGLAARRGGLARAWPPSPGPVPPDAERRHRGDARPRSSIVVLATGREFLPVGGFSGQVPSTPLRRLHGRRARRAHLACGRRRSRPRTRNPDMRLGHGPLRGGAPRDGTIRVNGNLYRRYVCTPPDTGGPPDGRYGVSVVGRRDGLVAAVASSTSPSCG